MYVHGSFLDRQGRTVSVHIVTGGTRTDERVIGDDKAGIFFTDDPVEITCETNDTFDHLLRHSASIRLLAREFVEGFFCVSAREAVVNICRGGVCLFAGFIEPQAYSQPFNELYDEVELNCIDALSALQYSGYMNAGSPGVSYDAAKAGACVRTFHETVKGILDGATAELDITGGSLLGVRYLYDGSKTAARSDDSYDLLKRLSISDLLFFGDEEDDLWTQETVLEEILRYLNLHIMQDGLDFYIFSWETVKAGGSIRWQLLRDGSIDLHHTTQRATVAISADIAADCDTSISIGEVYNQILVTCDVEKIEDVIENPLDSEGLTSPFANFQKYCTEYFSGGEGESAYNAFYAMVHGNPTSYDAAETTDWYLQLMRPERWTFPVAGTDTDYYDLFATGEGKWQNRLPDRLGYGYGATAVVEWGSVTKKMMQSDNSPVSKVSMTPYLVIAVNGSGYDDEERCWPDEAEIKRGVPCAVYTGNTAGGTFSPADDDTTNYIVISGSILLNPLMAYPHTYTDLREKEWGNILSEHSGGIYVWHQTILDYQNRDSYYTAQFFEAERPTDEPTWHRLGADGAACGLMPCSEKWAKQYEFKYSARGDSTDKISKVSVLACMLVIGDKCVVETGSAGQPSDFEWRTYKTREECADDDEYYGQSFNIGFDPKVGDKLIGTVFDIQNNLTYTKNVDATGTAIPIRRSDRVSGQVRFMILGAVNTVWGDYTRCSLSPFRRLPDGVPLLAHTSSIMVRELGIKVYSDNALRNNTGDSDLVYMSDTREDFKNRKDDIEFKINSALTSEECQELGVTNSVNMSTPSYTATGDAVLTVYDSVRRIEDKPERLYVDSYYAECHRPRIIMEQRLEDTGGDTVSFFNHYTHPALPGRTFFVQGVGRNLIEGTSLMTLKEIDND